MEQLPFRELAYGLLMRLAIPLDARGRRDAACPAKHVQKGKPLYDGIDLAVRLKVPGPGRLRTVSRVPGYWVHTNRSS